MAGYDVLRLSDFPVEILSMIFSMTDSVDKVNLSLVCESFNSVLNLQELSRSVNLQRAYELEADSIRLYLSDETRCNFITYLNLTSCYWIPSATMKKFLLKLKNLETMLVADTKLTTCALQDVVVALPKVKNLAFSWNGPVNIGKRNADLQSVYLYVPTVEKEPSSDILDFLKLCTKIAKISIVASTVPVSQKGMYFIERQYFSLPYLRYLLVKSEKGFTASFYQTSNRGPFIAYNKACLTKMLLASTEAESDWMSFWIPTNLNENYMFGESRFTFFQRNLGNSSREEPVMDRMHVSRDSIFGRHVDSVGRVLPKLRSLSVYCATRGIDDVIPSLFRDGCKLEELNIYGRYDEKVLKFCREMVDSLSSYRLRKLCIPVCAIWRKKTAKTSSHSSQAPQGFRKLHRISHLAVRAESAESDPCPPFLNLVRSCPNIEFFAMDNEETKYLTHMLPDDFEWDSEQLSHIANWTKLKKLILGGIPISSFKFLDEIGRGCQHITSLTLNFLYLTASAFNMLGLVKALPLFTVLEDLVIRQPKGISVLPSIRQKSLRRVLLICDKISVPEFGELLEHCTKVVFLYVVCDITKEEIKRIKSNLLKRFAHRQALIFHIVPRPCKFPVVYARNEWWESEAATVPGVHANEMLTGEIMIGGPISGEHYIQYQSEKTRFAIILEGSAMLVKEIITKCL